MCELAHQEEQDAGNNARRDEPDWPPEAVELELAKGRRERALESPVPQNGDECGDDRAQGPVRDQHATLAPRGSKVSSPKADSTPRGRPRTVRIRLIGTVSRLECLKRSNTTWNDFVW